MYLLYTIYMYQLYVNVLVIGTNCKYKLDEIAFQRPFLGLNDRRTR